MLYERYATAKRSQHIDMTPWPNVISTGRLYDSESQTHLARNDGTCRTAALLRGNSTDCQHVTKAQKSTTHGVVDRYTGLGRHPYEEEIDGLTVESSLVVAQNQLARIYGRLVLRMMGTRIGSETQYFASYPGVLARGLDAAKTGETLAELKTDFEALRFAKASRTDRHDAL